jgi:hypothetical protein
MRKLNYFVNPLIIQKLTKFEHERSVSFQSIFEIFAVQDQNPILLVESFVSKRTRQLEPRN